MTNILSSQHKGKGTTDFSVRHEIIINNKNNYKILEKMAKVIFHFQFRNKNNDFFNSYILQFLLLISFESSRSARSNTSSPTLDSVSCKLYESSLSVVPELRQSDSVSKFDVFSVIFWYLSISALLPLSFSTVQQVHGCARRFHLWGGGLPWMIVLKNVVNILGSCSMCSQENVRARSFFRARTFSGAQ